MSRNMTVNAINNLCHDFKVDVLCGCKAQVDWSMVPQAQWFHNLFGVGTETMSVVAPMNGCNRTNMGGCTMMAMGTMSPNVVESGVDITSLGCWCWMRVGLQTKKTHIVIAYQLCNSGWSAGTTVNNQQSQYFHALGDAKSPQTILYE